MRPGPVDVNDISNIHTELWKKFTIRNSSVSVLTRNQQSQMGIISLVMMMRAHGWHRKGAGAEPDRWACTVKYL